MLLTKINHINIEEVFNMSQNGNNENSVLDQQPVSSHHSNDISNNTLQHELNEKFTEK